MNSARKAFGTPASVWVELERLSNEVAELGKRAAAQHSAEDENKLLRAILVEQAMKIQELEARLTHVKASFEKLRKG